MPTITFSNSEHKDKTVYAVAGSHTETLLKLAKANKIPIPFDCQDGECGTCLVKVASLDNKTRMGGPPTEKERNLLKQLGKITDDDIKQILVDDFPPPWRLACQMIVRDENILVEY
ncbi:MAG: (2Fe-2S)-binding protein [Candidatus Competibacteraceae bacterium]|uniref:Ferredoxin-5 n=1 Tax=Candidatus Contendobacter odensis Run_B_J11 TaxID=1400861 RepID=A0A7U7J676_9GAMM|nr:2Fe-2S iron-sulfur cluster-binding protein [Candidatus Contendobacter odensis]MBK8537695.1 (2Fe-2S)-binding protein [Candidatus Competibacteraceae bacterium]MBK8750661.1 (2Fe-2S)-binding protein [Candidatus Competibacteraceae bacterium]CDH47807.1 Ferredoxin-5 [Candidatus Contendobacter odensis Run_B_J11]